MHRPVLVTPPARHPVTLDEAKAHLRVDHSDEDDLISGLVDAAVSHLEGWTGVLGAVMVEQEWRQDYDRFERCMALPLGPVMSIASVTHRSPDGTLSTIAASNYALHTDAGGRSHVSFDRDYSFPTDLHESRPIAVTYKAGYETIPEDGETPAQSTVPAALKAAILLMVGHWYANREAVVVGTITATLPIAVDSLISPYRRHIL